MHSTSGRGLARPAAVVAPAATITGLVLLVAVAVPWVSADAGWNGHCVPRERRLAADLQRALAEPPDNVRGAATFTSACGLAPQQARITVQGSLPVSATDTADGSDGSAGAPDAASEPYRRGLEDDGWYDAGHGPSSVPGGAASTRWCYLRDVEGYRAVLYLDQVPDPQQGVTWLRVDAAVGPQLTRTCA